MKRFLLLFLLTSYPGLSQTTDSTAIGTLPPKSDFKYGLMAELGLTFTSTSLPQIRSFFRSNEIEPAGHLDPLINFGVGGRYQRLKLMIQTGFRFGFTALPREESALVAKKVNVGYTGALLGYDVVNSRNRRLYINAGIGGVAYEYSVYRRTNQVVPFQSVLQYNQAGNIPSLRLTNNFWDVNIEYSQREKRKQSIEHVLRLGYRRGIRANAWDSDAFQLTGAPTDRISQFYFQGTYYFSSNYRKLGK
ncbi:hypothetical protein ACFSUS_06405 [Spirosoma soli]|uniref:Outer membrane beta-barrel protein n=1 Tax=Spirosoma soli TaxID=1770529 RepID=A0ABW5M127_9BACT